MEGYSNYNMSFYQDNYGTYSEFESQAIADGLTNVDSSDYMDYINVARQDWESGIKYTETFQLLSLTANYGYRFLPHKSIKPFISAGLTIKGKYRKVNYDHLRFSNDFIQDLSAVNYGINKYAEITTYTNLVVGLELYRFRMSAYLQYGFTYLFPDLEYDPTKIVYVNPWNAFDNQFSYGFSLGVDLFSQDFGKNLHKDNVTKDDLEISKIKRKRDKWDIGVRFSRRGFNELNTFYRGDSAATHFLNVYKEDTTTAYVDGAFVEGRRIEAASFGDIKRIGWSGQFDVFGTAYFGKRWLTEVSAGFSAQNFDVEAKELVAIVVEDSLGDYNYVESAGSPRVRNGVFRKSFNLLHFNAAAGYKLVDRDVFDLRLKVGGGITMMFHKFQGLTDQPDGVNELDLYYHVEEGYYHPSIADEIWINTDGPLEMDLNQSPDEVMNKFDPNYTMANYNTPMKKRGFYPTMKFGIDATVDRFSLGMAFESVIGYMDGYMLDKYGTIYFSIGYRILSR